MKISFLGQGFESDSPEAVGNYLMKFLSEKHFHSFTGISAFASEAGIYGLSKYISIAEPNFKNLNLVVGIDQGGTSKEALEEIQKLKARSYIYYHREQPIFHPKIYLFEGDKYIKILIGSSNLTASGLFTNIETSVLIEFEIGDKDGDSLLNQLKTYYKTLFDFSDPNLHPVTNEIILGFLQDGVIPNEETRQQNYSKKVAQPSSIKGSELGILVKKRAVPKVPNSFPRRPRVSKVKAAEPVGEYLPRTSVLEEMAGRNPVSRVSLTTATSDILVWQSGPLTQRDLNVPKGHNTNVTGSMLFKKGITKGIDQRHYFRDQVFSSLPWVHDTGLRTAHIERTTAFFKLIILGEEKGVFPLSLSHNTDKKSKSYKQLNSMTSISWGKAKKFIAKDALIGKSASLYRSTEDPNTFTLAID